VAWPDDGIGLIARAEQHTGYARFCRAARDHPLHAAVINVAGRQAPGIAPAKVTTRRGTEVNARAVRSTRLPPDQDRTGGTLLHWTIRPDKAAPTPPARAASRTG